MKKGLFHKLDRNANLTTLVIIPFIFLSLYFGFIASDRYISEAIVTIKENSSVPATLDIGLLGIGKPTGLEDEQIMKAYLLSADMMDFLNEKIDLKAHYQDSKIDWISSLPANATREEHLEYYRDHTDLYLDEVSGLLSIEVQAFKPDFARLLLNTMLQNAEQVLNRIFHSLAVAQYEFVEEQLEKTQDSLKTAKQRLLEYQNQHQIFSPEQQGQSLTAIMDVLEAELSQEKTKLKQILGFQKANSPQVIASKERIRALTEQINDEKQRLTGEGDTELSDLMSQFINLQVDLEFAKDAYASALAALEQSRAETAKQMKYLVVVSKPSLAEEAKYPDRYYILVTALIVLLMLYGIARMTFSTIREHKD